MQYVKELFRDPKKYFYLENLQDLRNWFCEETVDQKCFLVAKMIRKNTVQQNSIETIEFPSLSLLPPVIPHQKDVVEIRLLDYDGRVKIEVASFYYTPILK